MEVVDKIRWYFSQAKAWFAGYAYVSFTVALCIIVCNLTTFQQTDIHPYPASNNINKMDTAGAGTSPEDAAAARAADQARIRKERREAKIRAGGSARLNKITGLGGGIQRGMY